MGLIFFKRYGVRLYTAPDIRRSATEIVCDHHIEVLDHHTEL